MEINIATWKGVGIASNPDAAAVPAVKGAATTRGNPKAELPLLSSPAVSTSVGSSALPALPHRSMVREIVVACRPER